MLKRSVFALSFISGNLAMTAQVSDCQSSKAGAQPPTYYSAENMRSDTFDVLKYTISLEIGTTANQQIKGNTLVRFTPKMNNRTFIRFDLLKLQIDSIKENNTTLNYVYNDTVIRVNFGGFKSIGDTAEFRIYYHGQPVIDQTGWGGFYFNNTQSAEYAFNLGVGFGAKPHNYGRPWFPCFDNFVERSKYEFNITSDTARRAYCNGQLVSDIISNNMRTRKWILNEQIPTYLASVALARYSQVNLTVNAINGVKPITLVSHASDTSAMKAAFVNLPNCVLGFENYFGPYKWNRVGYCLVPFNGGAMEHATSITYPRSATGSLAWEELYAHELSHHWWGNLITCETQEDMWINEGMAVLSGYLFYEWQYGKASYLNKVKTEHENLLHFLHRNEGFRPISGVPHSMTYGDHVYKKGADVAHTMRGYLGDSAFFAGLKYVCQQKSFQSINSNEFRDLMQTGSGKSLTSFFNNWLYAGGWSHFAIDSVKYIPAAQNSFDAVISVKQKLYGATVLHSNVPLELSFFQNNWSRVTRMVTMNGATATFTVNIPFAASYCALNFDSKIGDASSHEYKTIKTTGNQAYTFGKALLLVQDAGQDSSLVRIIHNYVRPDPFKNNTQGHRLSDQHYWRVEGLLSPGFTGKLRLNYDGNKGSSGANIYLDTLLTIFNGDSLALFYRAGAHEEWQWLRRAHKQKTGLRIGYFEADSMRVGEYAFANLGDTLTIGVSKLESVGGTPKIFPNPATHTCRIEFLKPVNGDVNLRIFSSGGKLVLTRKIYSSGDVDISNLAAGSYTLQLEYQGSTIAAQKLLVE